MYDETHKHYAEANIVICAAAVADYRPKTVSAQKIKKSGNMTIDLVKTKDILYSLGQLKTSQYLVGFALETQHEVQHAKDKLKRKNLDAIVLNSLNDPGAGFGVDTNKITFIDTNNRLTPFELKSKAEVAVDILNAIIERRHA